MTDEDWSDDVPLSYNPSAVVVVVLAGLVAAGAMFVLPALTAGGLSVHQAFWLIGSVEFGAAIAAGLGIHWMYTRRGDDDE